MSRIWNYIWIVVLVFASCKHKELCMDHNHNANLMLEVKWHLVWDLKYHVDWEMSWNPDWTFDWRKTIPPEPTGVRLVAEKMDKSSPQLIFNLPPTGGPLELSPGMYSLLFYNNDTEYIKFEDGGDTSTLTATTRSRSRAPYSDRNPEEITVNPPDFLFSSHMDDFEVEEIKRNAQTGDVIRKEIDVPMTPVVFSYIVRYEFASEKEFVAEARGALSGMAGTVNLSTRRTLDDIVTVLYEDAEVSDYGVESVIRSFGLCNFDPVPTAEYPDGHYYSPDEIDSRAGESRQDRPRADSDTRNILTLELALRSGKVKTIVSDVTEVLKDQPRGGVIVVKGIVVTPEEGEGNKGGGFDVDVNDWGDHENIEIPV